MWGMVVQQRACHMACQPPDRDDNKAGPPKESCSRDRDQWKGEREKDNIWNLNYQRHWLWKGLENIWFQRPPCVLKINFAPWKIKSTRIQNVFFKYQVFCQKLFTTPKGEKWWGLVTVFSFGPHRFTSGNKNILDEIIQLTTKGESPRK